MARKFKGTTRIVINIDESGSMMRLRDATVAGVNQFITEQKANDADKATISLMTFDAQPLKFKWHYRGENINDVALLDYEDYIPRGGTPLFDAIARAINEGEALEKKGDRVVIVTMTDGYENSSVEYGDKVKRVKAPYLEAPLGQLWNVSPRFPYNDIVVDSGIERMRKLIESKERKGNWTFVFLGAGIDAHGTAESLGMAHGIGNFRTYDSTPQGQMMAYASLSGGVNALRSSADIKGKNLVEDPSASSN